MFNYLGAHPKLVNMVKAIEDNSKSELTTESHLVAIRHHPSLWFGPVLLLFMAVLPWPYGYYVFLRLALCLISVTIAFFQWKHDDALSGWVVVFSGIAVLYNPLVPIHLTKEIWIFLNLATACLFFGHFLALKKLLIYREPKSLNNAIAQKLTPLTKKSDSKTNQLENKITDRLE